MGNIEKGRQYIKRILKREFKKEENKVHTNRTHVIEINSTFQLRKAVKKDFQPFAS